MKNAMDKELKSATAFEAAKVIEKVVEEREERLTMTLLLHFQRGGIAKLHIYLQKRIAI